jgi:uncharacterized protein
MHVVNIIENISFKGGNFEKKFTSIELSIVQDADRLDAIERLELRERSIMGDFKTERHDPEIEFEYTRNKT